MVRDFAKEQEEARDLAEQVRATLVRVGFDPVTIRTDWQNRGRWATVFVGDREVGSLIALSDQTDEETLHLVRLRLLEAIAMEQRNTQMRAMRWTLLARPENVSPTIQRLWRVHLDDTIRGVNIAESLDGQGRRTFEPFEGGPELGAHQLYVDSLSEQARQLIELSGGTIESEPEAMRADGAKGREWVMLPEGTTMHGPDEFMAAQRFCLPNGRELVIQPHWNTVDMWVLGETKG